jgi:hypothetical protein
MLRRDQLAAVLGNNHQVIKEFERVLSDVQANIGGQSMITLNYTSAGVLTTPLPALYQFTLTASDQSVFRSGVSWGVTVLSGTFTGAGPTMGGTGTGILQLNTGLASPTASLAITARVDGRGYPAFTVTIGRSNAPTEGGGGGGTASDSTSTFTGFSTNSFVAITRDLAVTLPAAVTTATLTAAAIELFLDNDAPGGDTECEFKWQRETAPSVWTDVGISAFSLPNPTVEELVEPGSPSFYLALTGGVTCNRTETGMVAASAQKFRLVARVSAGNIRSVVAVGTAGVTS